MVKFHEAKHYLRDVRPLKIRSWKVKNLRCLAEALDLMDNKTFKSHIRGKNSFAAWVERELGDDDLAKRMRLSRTREDLLKVADDRYIELDEVIASSHMTSGEFLSIGAVDFVIGIIIGFMGGLILATLFG